MKDKFEIQETRYGTFKVLGRAYQGFFYGQHQYFTSSYGEYKTRQGAEKKLAKVQDKYTV